MPEVSSLQATHDALRQLGLYLLEIAARAQIAGSNTLVVQLGNFVGMSSTVMRAVLDIEGVLGNVTGGPVPPIPPTTTPTAGAFDATAFLRQFTDQIQEYAQATQKQALEALQKQFEDQKVKTPKADPANPT